MAIIGIIGAPGVGKTLVTIEMLATRTQYRLFSNMDIRFPNVTRIRKDWIAQQVIVTNLLGKKKVEHEPNKTFWKQLKQDNIFFDVVLDEVQNFVHSRQGMRSENVARAKWFTEIRKVLGQGERNHCILTSQRLEAFDVSFSRLVHEYIVCEKFWITPQGKRIPGTAHNRQFANKIPTKTWENGKLIITPIEETFIMKYHFIGHGAYKRCETFLYNGAKCYDKRTYIIGNKWMQYYDSYAFAEFSDEYA